MSVEEMKTILDRWWDEIWIKKNLSIADDLLADNVVLHNFGVVLEGREAWKETMTPFFTGFPDLDMPIEFTVAEGDKIAVRWTATGTHTGDFRGIAPTGKQINIAGVAVARIAEGKIVEIWSQPDTLGLLQQLGVIPIPG